MSEVLFGVIVLLAGYAGYLRLQLHIQQRVVSAFQNAAVVVPPAERPHSEIHPGLVVVVMILLSGAMCAWLAR